MKTIYISGLHANIIGANAYVYYDEQTLAGVVIDPGVEAEKVIAAIDPIKIDLQHILLTHGHFDHITAAPCIKQKYGADLCVLNEENVILSNAQFNVSSLIGNPISLCADQLLHDGDEIHVGSGTLKVIHTPGHTVGSACYYDEKNRILFAGDTLFFESIGRTDLHTGNSQDMIASIRQKLFSLPEDVTVFCGHGEHTTIGHEKKYNPYVNENPELI